MATHGKIDEFDPSHKTWATYVERLEVYFIANGIERPREEAGSTIDCKRPRNIQVDPELVGSQKIGREIVRRASGPGKVAL